MNTQFVLDSLQSNGQWKSKSPYIKFTMHLQHGNDSETFEHAFFPFTDKGLEDVRNLVNVSQHLLKYIEDDIKMTVDLLASKVSQDVGLEQKYIYNLIKDLLTQDFTYEEGMAFPIAYSLEIFDGKELYELTWKNGSKVDNYFVFPDLSPY